MGEQRQNVILLASVLKPVDDTRMSGKMATSLARAGFRVHVAGYPTEKTQTRDDIRLIPHAPFRRLSVARFFVPWKVLAYVRDIRPAVLVITTHELLCVAVIARILYGCRIIYDIQENYFINILHTDAFPRWIRPFIAAFVRAKEVMLTPFVSHFLLAERSYGEELAFLRRERITIIENKAIINQIVPPRQRHYAVCHKLLFSGTLSTTSGVFTAIALAKALHAADPAVTLTIAGYAAREAVRKQLRKEAAHHPFITLEGVDRLVPHDRIDSLICTHHAGIISYDLNPSTRGSIPTKLYEYLAARLPILLIRHEPWVRICAKYPAAIIFGAGQTDPSRILDEYRATRFYTRTPEDVSWNDEEGKLLTIVNELTARAGSGPR